MRLLAYPYLGRDHLEGLRRYKVNIVFENKISKSYLSIMSSTHHRSQFI